MDEVDRLRHQYLLRDGPHAYSPVHQLHHFNTRPHHQFLGNEELTMHQKRFGCTNAPMVSEVVVVQEEEVGYE